MRAYVSLVLACPRLFVSLVRNDKRMLLLAMIQRVTMGLLSLVIRENDLHLVFYRVSFFFVLSACFNVA